MIVNNEYRTVKIESVKPHPRNPRKGDVSLILKSIDKNGFYGAIVVQESTGYILAGNHRWKAARDAGMSVIPAIFVDCDDEQALRILLADNKTSDDATYDEYLLSELLQSFDDLEGTGYTLKDVDALSMTMKDREQSVVEPELVDPADELQEKWQVRFGDIYKLGDHFIICGDSTDQATVDAVLRGKRPSLIWTDPPYGVDIDNQNKFRLVYRKRSRMRSNSVLNGDACTPEGVSVLVKNAIEAVKAKCEQGCTVYCCSSSGPMMFPVIEGMIEAGVIYKYQLVWVKQHFVLTRGDYHAQCESIHYGWFDNGQHKWYGGRDKSTVIQIDRPMSYKEHPTMKPTELVVQTASNNTLPGEVVYDPFGGSGTTMVACEQMGRKAVLVEIEPKYVAVCLERMAKINVPAELIHRDGDGVKSKFDGF